MLDKRPLEEQTHVVLSGLQVTHWWPKVFLNQFEGGSSGDWIEVQVERMVDHDEPAYYVIRFVNWPMEFHMNIGADDPGIPRLAELFGLMAAKEKPSDLTLDTPDD